MQCSEANTFLHAYVDGELAGVDRDAYEQHLVGCDLCSRACRLQARFKAAVRGHVTRPAVPARLQQSITSAIAAQPPIRRRRVWDSYPRLVPAAAAAAMLLVIVGVSRTRRASVLVEQALRTFHAGVPMDYVDSNCASVANFFRGRVNFAVPAPPLGDRAVCQGGRLVNLQDSKGPRFGAYFQLQVGDNHRLAMTIVDGDEDEGAPDGAERRVFGGQDVYMARTRGSTTAAYRGRDGLIYILTGDLDESSMSTILEAALRN